MSEEFIPEDYFDLLNSIRETGAMNMFEAPRWLEAQMELSKEQAMDVFTAWMETFKND